MCTLFVKIEFANLPEDRVYIVNEILEFDNIYVFHLFNERPYIAIGGTTVHTVSWVHKCTMQASCRAHAVKVW